MTMLSIIIKTLNEEDNISRCIESCLRVAKCVDCEIIVADSGSGDRTVEIARRYPITIVQVRHRAEGRCGAGPQLGYQLSRGRYLYILDGDMELDAGFIRTAIAYLEKRPTVAGFGGVINEMRTENLEFKSRRQRNERYVQERGQAIEQPHQREYLAGGALYSRAAIIEAEYLTDRNLHGNEEYDLGARLRAKGWTLIRSHEKAVDHYSHTKPTLSLMWHRVRSGMVLGVGEIVRAGFAQGYLAAVLREVRIVRIGIAVYGFWALAIVLALALRGSVAMPFVTVPFAGLIGLSLFMTFRTGSLKLALYSLLSWHVAALGLAGGLVARRVDPRLAIACVIFKPEGQAAADPVLAAAS